MAHLTDADAIALIDACLDDKATIKQMVDALRAKTGDGLLGASDFVVYALKKSKHVDAPAMLDHIRACISRYKMLDIPI